MKRSSHATAAFSMVEVVLALGVAAFCLIAVFGLLPVGVQTNRNATSQTAATSLLASVIADLRATPKPPAVNTSSQYKIVFGTSKTLYFDSLGRCSIAGTIVLVPYPFTDLEWAISYSTASSRAASASISARQRAASFAFGSSSQSRGRTMSR